MTPTPDPQQQLEDAPRGEHVLEQEVFARATPELIDFGVADENPAYATGILADAVPADGVASNPIPDATRHLFRRGELHAEVRQGGNVQRTYLCACGCGEIR